VYENASVEHRSAFRAMLELLARQQGKTEGEIQEELKAKWRRGIRIAQPLGRARAAGNGFGVRARSAAHQNGRHAIDHRAVRYAKNMTLLVKNHLGPRSHHRRATRKRPDALSGRQRVLPSRS